MTKERDQYCHITKCTVTKPKSLYKMFSENAVNAISEIQILNSFRGSTPAESSSKLMPSSLAPPIFGQVSATAFGSESLYFTVLFKLSSQVIKTVHGEFIPFKGMK